MDEAMLKEICAIAKSVGAWVLCDEVYRGLTQEELYSPSVADLYERGSVRAVCPRSLAWPVYVLVGLRVLSP